jgi:hypothetical protein
MKKIIVLFISIIMISVQPVWAEDLNIDIQKMNASEAVTKGGNNQRGPALAVLKNGDLLLGGGSNGGTVYLGDGKKRKLIKLGDLISSSQRKKDSRFAITDILILNESSKLVQTLVSYPRLGSNGNCVEVRVDEVEIDLSKNQLSRKSNWFVSKPCVPIGAVQHASGRMEKIDSNSAYLTIGDLGYKKIDDVNLRKDLGSVFKISKNSVSKVSFGHRNMQGILSMNNLLLVSEHGPRGGDEINIVKQNTDYGWPFVTYGKAYGVGDYIKPKNNGTHKGYEEPIKYWVPSIAPTELVQVPKNWGNWSNQIAMGTLKEEVLVFLKINSNNQITEEKRINVNERIRDLDTNLNNEIIATTDSGKIMVFKYKK